MATETAAKPKKETPKEPEQLVPPDEQFWQRYSPHYEFPLSNVGSVMIHIVVIGLFLIYINRMLEEPVPPSPPVRGTMVIDAEGGEGLGSAGSGGGHEEVKEKNDRPEEAAQPLPEAELKRELVAAAEWAPELKDNPEALQAIAESPNKKKLDKIGDSLKKSLLGLGEKKGEGTGPGNSRTGQEGKGEGGVGDATSSQRRSGRWILIFRTENGSDYLAQLASLQAQLVVPTPNGKYLHIRDLNNLGDRKEITEQQIPTELMHFIDDNKDSVRRVTETLNLQFQPKFFIAVVPKDVENDLAAKERSYRNRKETEIFSTSFRVLVRDGKYTVTVIDQQVNKR